jgi:quinol monooxygenase YgiN
MEYMNVVRIKLKPGKFDEWKAAATKGLATVGKLDGALGAQYIKTGDNAICVIGRWASEEALAAARPAMIASLDQFRHLVDGDTDPVSGPVILSTEG